MTLWFEQKRQSHYFSPNSNASLEIGNFGEPLSSLIHRIRARTHTHTHGITNATFPSLFFRPLYRLRLILTDLRLKKETRIHIRSVSFKERAKPRQLLRASPPLHSPPKPCDVSWRRNLTSSSLERAKMLRMVSAHSWRRAARFFLRAQVQ